MKRLIFTFAFSLVAVNAAAKVSTTGGTLYQRDGAAAPCTSASCLSGTSSSSTVDQLRQLRSSVGGDQSPLDLFEYNKGRKQEANCSNFVTENGLGKWGKSISRNLNANDYSYLFEGTDDLRLICPSYSSLKNSEKKIIWISIINVMSIGESTCGTDPRMNRAQGPNGRLAGVIQLHSGKEHKYSPGCNKGDSKTPETTFSCTLHMMDDQLRREGKLFSRKSYWDVLRPQGVGQKFKEIKKVIGQLSICK
ncbi:hypothetical protein EZJ49_12670 [Bdellovibrio bacteriovorus]|uniref:hypothetical protein n=1 Tax=Bdellovibrio bacteriovorus TaxID=959 RepID=UPI0021CFB500|nr:hypothetical protein [Bdellovibrio bacteriovorus]UXR63918.1 hypothetical protein EZJ49_12670 [Bdellovibrio bacteriovorus]